MFYYTKITNTNFRNLLNFIKRYFIFAFNMTDNKTVKQNEFEL